MVLGTWSKSLKNDGKTSIFRQVSGKSKVEKTKEILDISYELIYI